MKLHNKILSTILAVVLLVSALSGTVVVQAAGTSTTSSSMETIYFESSYNTPEERVFGDDSNMELRLERNGYQLWVDNKSGEIAVVDSVGNIMLSNPFDVGSSSAADSTKAEIMSQLAVQYIDNGATKYMYSFTEAALRDQITVLNIKNGVRVEYTIGQEESRKLVPRQLSRTSFETLLRAPLDAAVADGYLDEYSLLQFQAFYLLQSLEQQSSQKAKDRLLRKYPICEFMDIYVCQDTTNREANLIETIIKNYCEDYTFEQMDADHEETGYEAVEEQYPVFKMALEYSLDEDGLSVRLPCNGLRYDMSTYTLENISVLPYMGAGSSANEGYNFFPDGSGALFDYQQLNTRATTKVSAKVYGIDYAYHEISGKYQKTIRYPVYGTATTEEYYTFSYTAPDADGVIVPTTLTVASSVLKKDEIKDFIEQQEGSLISEIATESRDRGYVAIIEEGESLAELETYHAGSLSQYHTVKNYFNPKPKDSYKLADSISVTNTSTWTVVTDRKYTGNITIRYMLLTDKEVGEAKKTENTAYTYYEPTWFGMAEAYRDYLVKNGTLTLLKDSGKLEENIPLYLEVFGALETTQTIATIPVDVMTPLTTFDNILDIYKSLSGSGVKNINFKMTGFANGGMTSTVPSSLKWEKNVGGKSGFLKLIEEATKINQSDDQNIGLFPDFDFAYIQSNTLFDSTNLKKDAVKTIDNRYSSKRQYSATKQTYVSFYQLAISPSRFSKFYEKLLANYDQYGLKSFSVASLGSALNSDFDEDDPYNREDSKSFTIQAFEDMQGAGYSLMTDSANAYTWGYVDHILNVDLDSSRYIKSSASVPFVGVVLHGYVQFAGSPFNEEGDTDYAMLRAIENGAGLYFILSYQNTNELKENSMFNRYYSVRYDIWEEDIVSYYKQLNDLLKDVQDKVIIDHKFLNDEAKRVLDLDELQAEIAEELLKAAEQEQKKQEDLEVSKALEIADAWSLASNARSTIEKMIAEMQRINTEDIMGNFNVINSLESSLLAASESAASALLQDPNSEQSKEAVSKISGILNTMKLAAANVIRNYSKLDEEKQKIEEFMAELLEIKDFLANAESLSPEVREAMAEEVQLYYEDALTMMSSVETQMKYASSRGASKEKTVEKALKIQSENITALKESSGKLAPAEDLLQSACASLKFTADDIYEEAEKEVVDTDEDQNDDEQTADSFFTLSNNQIVLVTYGDRDATTHQKTPVKSFILNYNNFTVRVNYNSITYTIPSGGYVVIEY